MKNIEDDLDYIMSKTQQLFTLLEKEQYPLLETKELVRQQLIQQFFINYSLKEISTVSKKFQQLVDLSTQVTIDCEEKFETTKSNILKIKKSAKIKNAYLR